MSLAIFEIRPHRGGWQCFEAPGVEPYWVGERAKEHALSYVRTRLANRRGEIRVLAGDGSVTETIPFDERPRWD